MSSMKRYGFIFCLDQGGTAVRILTVLWCSHSIDEDSSQNLNPFIMKCPFFPLHCQSII